MMRTRGFDKAAGVPFWTAEGRPEGVAHTDVRHQSHPFRHSYSL